MSASHSCWQAGGAHIERRQSCRPHGTLDSAFGRVFHLEALKSLRVVEVRCRAMSDAPPPQSDPQRAICGPKCNYDLRGQLGPPVPFTVQCPECGAHLSTLNLLRPRTHLSLLKLALWTVLPMPIGSLLILVGLILTQSEVVLIILMLYGSILGAIFAGIHASTLAFLVAMHLSDRAHRSLLFASCVLLSTFLYDGAIVLALSRFVVFRC